MISMKCDYLFFFLIAELQLQLCFSSNVHCCCVVMFLFGRMKKQNVIHIPPPQQGGSEGKMGRFEYAHH